MKHRLGVQQSRPLADFLPAITIKAKDFATEITIFNVKDKNINAGDKIAWEHVINNQSVRKLLLERGIEPENLPAEADVKKLKRRVKLADQKFIQNPDKLEQTET
jgi:DNA-damage-inducible protein D